MAPKSLNKSKCGSSPGPQTGNVHREGLCARPGTGIATDAPAAPQEERRLRFRRRTGFDLSASRSGRRVTPPVSRPCEGRRKR
jgi:hypothetical protein